MVRKLISKYFNSNTLTYYQKNAMRIVQTTKSPHQLYILRLNMDQTYKHSQNEARAYACA